MILREASSDFYASIPRSFDTEDRRVEGVTMDPTLAPIVAAAAAVVGQGMDKVCC